MARRHRKPSRKAHSPTTKRTRPRARLRAEALEPRILLSASWVDADTGEALDGATAGNDAFHGDAGADLAHGLDGDDFLAGGDGADRLSGGAGADRLSGGAGNDVLSGGRGDDVLSGGAGHDRLWGGSGDDLLRGGAGNDRLAGGSGADVLRGGAGNDVLHGGSGNDVLAGGSGNDRLSGGSGADRLSGGAGNDRLVGGAGDDVLHGGAGDDVLVGGRGHDMVSYEDAPSGVHVDLTARGFQDTGGGGTDALRGVEGVRGSAHDDTFSFSRPRAGATYTVEGGGGMNTLDLSRFAGDQVSVSEDGSSLEVDLGGGRSFRIEFTDVQRIETADGVIEVAAPASGSAPPAGEAPAALATPSGFASTSDLEGAAGTGAGSPHPAPAAGGAGDLPDSAFEQLRVLDAHGELPEGLDLSGGAEGVEIGVHGVVGATLDAVDAPDPAAGGELELEAEEPAGDAPPREPFDLSGFRGERFEDVFEVEAGDPEPVVAPGAAAEVGPAPVEAPEPSFFARMLALVRSAGSSGGRSEDEHRDSPGLR